MSANDQRSSPRSRLLLLAMARAHGAGSGQLRIKDLSAGGLKAATELSLAAGSAIEVELRSIGWVGGTVAWVEAGQIGVRFDAPIDPERTRTPVSGRYAAPGGPPSLLRRV